MESYQRGQGGELLILSSFTAQPMGAALEFWCSRLDVDLPIVFAPIAQIFQGLLNPSGHALQNKGINVVLTRVEDFAKVGQDETLSDGVSCIKDQLDKALSDLADSVSSYRTRTSAPLIIVLCPPFPERLHSPIGEILARAEQTLCDRLRRIDQVIALSSQQLLDWYNPGEYYDRVAFEEGLIPYTAEMNTAIATAVARSLHMLLYAEQYKAIVVDCDNTLWSGIVGEVGPEGLSIDEGRRFLQQALIEQVRLGRLVCLCSRNNEQDVWDVFDRHPGMLLQRSHLAAWRINWQPKHGNLGELARDLNIHQGSFVYLEDDPSICAEMEALMPEVLTLRVPGDTHLLKPFVRHIWAFDRMSATSEDQSRTEHYRNEDNRRTLQAETLSYEDFLNKLNLQVDVKPADPMDFARVSQLLARTTQFNTTSLRFTSAELARWLADDSRFCRVVRVADRFGDYGLVGCVLYTVDRSSIIVQVMALSCRVLGRGAEDMILDALKAEALVLGKEKAEFRFLPTSRNQPAALFFQRVTGKSEGNDKESITYEISVNEGDKRWMQARYA